MITNMEKSFEEVTEVYSGFPFKDNFMKIGNQALKKYDIAAELEDDTIHIRYLSRPLYDEEELSYFDEEDMEEAKKQMLEAEALIRIGSNPKEGIIETGFDCWPATLDEDDDFYVDDYYITADEETQAVEIIEAFLNVAIDCES